MLMTPEIKALIDERKKNFIGLEVAEVMKKVVLTEAQAEFVEKYKAVRGLAEKLSKAISEGYEVEPEFKAGDKVILWGKVVTLKENRELLGSEAWSVEENNGVRLYTSDLVRATPEAVYWLETLNRDFIGDFREGDIFVFKGGFERKVHKNNSGENFTIGTAVVDYEIGDFSGVYPAGSFKSFTKEAVK